MFEDKLIRPDSLRNVFSADTAVGFTFTFKLPSDRGMWLSLIGGFYLSIDEGPAYPASEMTLILNGQSYPVETLASQTAVHWPAYAPAQLMVRCPGGLKPGPHDVDFQVITLGGYYKAKEEWVQSPPVPGRNGSHRFRLICGG